MKTAPSFIYWASAYGGKTHHDINGVGVREKMAPQMIDRIHGTNDYLLMHFHNEVQLGVGETLQTYPPHTFIIWTPQTRHLYGSLTGSWTHSWIHTNAMVFKNAFGLRSIEEKLQANTPYTLSGSHLTEKYLEELGRELTEPLQPNDIILEGFLCILVQSLRRLIFDESGNSRLHSSRSLLRLRRITHFIEQHLSETLTLTQVADEAELSVSQLCAEFKTYLGVSPIAYVLERRLEQALYLLRDRNLSVAQISVQLGFQSPFYFSRQFKKRYGQSPTHFRNNSLF